MDSFAFWPVLQNNELARQPDIPWAALPILHSQAYPGNLDCSPNWLSVASLLYTAGSKKVTADRCVTSEDGSAEPAGLFKYTTQCWGEIWMLGPASLAVSRVSA